MGSFHRLRQKTEQRMASRTRTESWAAGVTRIEDQYLGLPTQWQQPAGSPTNRIRKIPDLIRQLPSAPTCSEPEHAMHGNNVVLSCRDPSSHSKPLLGQAQGKCLPHWISQSSPPPQLHLGYCPSCPDSRLSLWSSSPLHNTTLAKICQGPEMMKLSQVMWLMK